MSQLKNNIANLKAYSTTESLDNFASSEEIQVYRDRRIARY